MGPLEQPDGQARQGRFTGWFHPGDSREPVPALPWSHKGSRLPSVCDNCRKGGFIRRYVRNTRKTYPRTSPFLIVVKSRGFPQHAWWAVTGSNR